MEHIKQHDWCSTEPDIYFLSEADIDNCVTEKILRNKFHDPLVSSESEDEDKPQVKLDWDEIFNRKKNNLTFRTVVQGIHPLPQYPKLSALTVQQHFQCIKVLSSQNPDVLPGVSLARPTKQDYKVFEEVKEIYQKEQLEFAEWAKSLWTSDHCVRALRPKPPIEVVYEAEFKVRANSLQSFPKNYGLAAQIPLENPNAVCELIHLRELIKVNITTLPQIQKPDMTKKTTIMKPCPVPEPCNKHPCHFVLPNDGTMTILPLTEIYRELAQYAFDNGACNIASESALRCLMQDERHWALPVAVCRVLAPDGEPANVVVLGSEFAVHKETAQVRTYKAFRRLLENALVPPLEKRLANRKRDVNDTKNSTSESEDTKMNMDVSDDDDDDQLYIDTNAMQSDNEEVMEEETSAKEIKSPTKERKSSVASDEGASANKIDFYNCTCKDTPFERAAPRSFRAWRVRGAGLHHDLVVHCAHRARGATGEVLLEPIPEYQLELAASAPPRGTARAHALSLALRKNASLLNVRIDSASGDIVTLESVSPEALAEAHAGVSADVSNRLHTALEQLRGLLPGHYVLCHEPSHGSNALLYAGGGGGGAAGGGAAGGGAAGGGAAGGGTLRLAPDAAPPADADEALGVRTPPRLVPAFLPVHKHRRTLPCAFTPHSQQLPRQPRRAPARRRAPPQALQWPKRKGRKKNNN